MSVTRPYTDFPLSNRDTCLHFGRSRFPWQNRVYKIRFASESPSREPIRSPFHGTDTNCLVPHSDRRQGECHSPESRTEATNTGTPRSSTAIRNMTKTTYIKCTEAPGASSGPAAGIRDRKPPPPNRIPFRNSALLKHSPENTEITAEAGTSEYHCA